MLKIAYLHKLLDSFLQNLFFFFYAIPSNIAIRVECTYVLFLWEVHRDVSCTHKVPPSLAHRLNKVWHEKKRGSQYPSGQIKFSGSHLCRREMHNYAPCRLSSCSFRSWLFTVGHVAREFFYVFTNSSELTECPEKRALFPRIAPRSKI